MKKRYRSKIFCMNCNKVYVTNLLSKNRPNRCKLCGSIKITPLKIWEDY